MPNLLAISSNSEAADIVADRPFLLWLLVRTFDIGNNFGASVRPVCSGVQELVLRTLQTRSPKMFREVHSAEY